MLVCAVYEVWVETQIVLMLVRSVVWVETNSINAQALSVSRGWVVA